MKKLEQKDFLINSIPVMFFLLLLLIKFGANMTMQSPFIFSDEQSYFGMAHKISDGRFGDIYNSHMPGYSLLVAPIYAMADNSFHAYLGVLFFNSLISSFPMLISFYLSKNILNMSKGKAVILSAMMGTVSVFCVYNNVVMSETLLSVLYFCVFWLVVMMIKTLDKRGYWCICGMLVGFMPTVKSQTNITLIIYFLTLIVGVYIFRKNKMLRNNMLFSLLSMSISFAFFHIMFPNTGLYESLMSDYVGCIKQLFCLNEQFWTNWLNLFKIGLGEIGLLFIFTGIVPFLAVVAKLFAFLKTISKENTLKILFIIAGLFILIANLGITTLHAFYVSCNHEIVPVYSRYVDCFQPIIVYIGGYVILEKDGLISEKISSKRCLLILSIVFFLLIDFKFADKIFANTLSIFLFTEMNIYLFFILVFVLCGLGYICLKIEFAKYLLCVIICFIFLAMDVSTYKKIWECSVQMVEVYPETYYIAKNNIKDQVIVIDSDIRKHGDNEDSIMKYQQWYSLLFWAYKDNEIHFEKVNSSKEGYVYTNKLLMRNVLEMYGPVFLYDKEEKKELVITPYVYSHTTKGDTGLVREDCVGIYGKSSVTDLYINDVHDLEITINFYLVDLPFYLTDHIKCKINGNWMEATTIEKDKIIFEIHGEENFDVESMELVIEDDIEEYMKQGVICFKDIEVKFK